MSDNNYITEEVKPPQFIKLNGNIPENKKFFNTMILKSFLN